MPGEPRLTERAKGTIRRAGEEARLQGLGGAGTEHLLAGLLTQEDSGALHILRASGADLAILQRRVRERMPVRKPNPPEGEVPLNLRGKWIVDVARYEAQTMGHPQIGTEHLLLALLRAEGTDAARILRNGGLEVAVIRELVRAAPAPGSVVPPPEGRDKIGPPMWQRFTERARKVVFQAQEEAQGFGEGYVSTEHLLLGILREFDSVALKALGRLGVAPEDDPRGARAPAPPEASPLRGRT